MHEVVTSYLQKSLITVDNFSFSSLYIFGDQSYRIVSASNTCSYSVFVMGTDNEPNLFSFSNLDCSLFHHLAIVFGCKFVCVYASEPNDNESVFVLTTSSMTRLVVIVTISFCQCVEFVRA